jgi:hypothetical protein
MDFRDVPHAKGSFNKIVSLEMAEVSIPVPATISIFQAYPLPSFLARRYPTLQRVLEASV